MCLLSIFVLIEQEWNKIQIATITDKENNVHDNIYVND